MTVAIALFLLLSFLVRSPRIELIAFHGSSYPFAVGSSLL